MTLAQTIASFFSLFLCQTNLGDIVQDDDGMHMVDIVVDNDSNDLFAVSFCGRVNVVAIDIGNGYVTDIVVMVPSYNGHSGVV